MKNEKKNSCDYFVLNHVYMNEKSSTERLHSFQTTLGITSLECMPGYSSMERTDSFIWVNGVDCPTHFI